VGHLRQSGFPVAVKDTDDVGGIKRERRVPPSLQGCHTALVEGYVVEGHVPADLIDRLLRERPKIVGLAVPGMPAGSPGMDLGPGQKREPYQVYAFDAASKATVFATR
jgi:hypothetical protein